MKAIAFCETTVQVSEDSWSVIKHSLEIDETTTLKQITQWVNSKPGQPPVRGEVRFSVFPLDALPHVNCEHLADSLPLGG